MAPIKIRENLRRWLLYFDEEEEKEYETTMTPDMEAEDIKEPSSEQLQNGNVAMNNNKSPGTDNIHAKLIKKRAYDLYNYLHQ
jgi:hypothetical protein